MAASARRWSTARILELLLGLPGECRGIQVLGWSAAAFPSTLTGSCIKSGAGGTRIDGILELQTEAWLSMPQSQPPQGHSDLTQYATVPASSGAFWHSFTYDFGMFPLPEMGLEMCWWDMKNMLKHWGIDFTNDKGWHIASSLWDVKMCTCCAWNDISHPAIMVSPRTKPNLLTPWCNCKW